MLSNRAALSSWNTLSARVTRNLVAAARRGMSGDGGSVFADPTAPNNMAPSAATNRGPNNSFHSCWSNQTAAEASLVSRRMPGSRRVARACSMAELVSGLNRRLMARRRTRSTAAPPPPSRREPRPVQCPQHCSSTTVRSAAEVRNRVGDRERDLITGRLNRSAIGTIFDPTSRPIVAGGADSERAARW